MEYNSTLDVFALENSVMYEANEYMRKIELGRELKRIITEYKYMKASLSAEDRKAFEFFEKHGQDKYVKPVEWRAWQKGLLKYINNPTQRRMIWVVGGEGNEGKTFFIQKIEEQYGERGFVELVCGY